MILITENGYEVLTKRDDEIELWLNVIKLFLMKISL